MLADILKLMRCPTCHTDLKLIVEPGQDDSQHIVRGHVACQKNHSWPIEEGVVAFSREDALSDPWSKSFKDYEKFVANKRYRLSQSKSDVSPIIESIPPNATGPYLDMCTGDGALLFTILDKVNPLIPIVSVDMSLHAQKYNKRYLSETHGYRPVSFISSDASLLPFKDGVIPCVISFGMGNMLDKFANGIREAQRVLQGGGVFIFTHMYVDEDSEGWRTVKGVLGKLGMEDCGHLGLQNDFNALMQSANFSKYTVDVLREVIGAADRDVKSGPIFPYPNELQQELLIRAWK